MVAFHPRPHHQRHGGRMLTAEQIKTLEELGFVKGSIQHKSDNSPMWDYQNGHILMTVYIDGSYGFSNTKTHLTLPNYTPSGKFRSIIAKLREGELYEKNT